MTEYGTYLRGRLESLGLSRNALARALGHKGASQVSRWCAGKAVPREKARAKIEAALANRHRELIEWAVRIRWAESDYEWGPQTPQDAPGTTIPGGEAPLDPLTEWAEDIGAPAHPVERYVVEGG